MTSAGAALRARLRGVQGGPEVLLALVAWNAGNFLFFIIARFVLHHDDYGLVTALLAATIVVLVPCGSFQYAVARLVAGRPAGDPSSGAVYRRAWRRALWIAPALGALAVLAIAIVDIAARPIPVGPLVVTVLVVLPMGMLMLALGQLQGERRFRGFALSYSLLGAPRPALLPLLAVAGAAVYAALTASFLSVLAAALVAAYLTRAHLRGAADPNPEEWRAFVRSLAPLAVGLAGVALLTNVDVIVAKLALPAGRASDFGAVSVLAKGVLVVPQAISTIVLPRVAERRARGRETASLLASSVAMTIVVGGVASLLCLAVADPIVRVVYGSKYLGGASLLAGFAAASTLLGAILVLFNHHAGRRDDRFVWAMGGLALADAALLAAFHSSAAAIVAVDAGIGVLGLVLHEAIHGRDDDGLVRGLVRLLGSGQRGRSSVAIEGTDSASATSKDHGRAFVLNDESRDAR